MADNVFKLPGASAPKPEPKFVFRPIKPYLANIECPSCAKGHMIAVPMDQMLATARTLKLGSPNFNLCQHRCNECEHEEFYSDRFPALRYFEVGQEPT